MNANLYDKLFSAASPSAIAIETPGGHEVSYGALAGLAARFANAIVARGVRPGDRVAVQVEKSVEAIALYLGTLRAGAVYLPLNTAYTSTELDYFLGDAEPALVVSGEAGDAIGQLAAARGIATDTLDGNGDGTLSRAAADASAEFDCVARSGDDLAAILYTSGTTGRPKGAMLSHENLASNARTLVEAWRITSQDTLIHALPIFHVHGLFVAIHTMMMAGGRMILLQKFDAPRIVSLMDRATVLMGVPTFYTRLLHESTLTREACAGMRLFVSGSAPLLAQTHEAFEERTGHAILERYGMTETGMNTSNPYEGDRIPGTVGFPLPGVGLRVCDPETGSPLGKGEVGMIEVAGPNVFSGYWRKPEKNETEFRKDGYFITGDLGTVDERGYVHIVGRGKDLIITGGYNVYPKEVETEIDAMPGIVESAVIGLPDDDMGERVGAVIVREGNADTDEAAILTHLGDRLARYKLPRTIIFTAELPRNTMGKVQKNVLRERYSGPDRLSG